MGLEGIVSKRTDAPYRSGPSKLWLKSKNPASEDGPARAGRGVAQALAVTMSDDSWQRSHDQNVFQMYVAHGGPGFWVRRTTWGFSCARVVRVGEMTKSGPYFGNPSVLMDVYSLQGELKDEAAPLPVAGTYKTWRKIDPPDWATSADLRPLDDPKLDAALSKLDRKRGKAKPPAERVRLRVPYEQKDVAKRLGARWDRTERVWWLSAENETAITEAKALGFLPES